MRSSARAELAAAGIRDPALQVSYLACRELVTGHASTRLATQLLPARRRPAVHALLGFAHHAAGIVDHPGDEPGAVRAARLDALGAELAAAFAGGPTTHPLVPAVADTARAYGIDQALFPDVLAAMALETHDTTYATLAELERHLRGSTVIGRQMLTVLGTVVPSAEAAEPAAAIGVAFRLTGVLRDVGADLVRGRLHLPADELAAFGVDRELLGWCRRAERVDPRTRAVLAHLVAHTRARYAQAEPVTAMVEPASRPCVRSAFLLHRRILDEFEAAGYPLHGRVTVSGRARAGITLPGTARALAARARETALRRPSTGPGA